ncbi:Mur ligase family protein [Natronospora cellulosivora (SeqCode)]
MERVLLQENTFDFTGITCDSRIVKPGYAFIAIRGFETDGNKYILEAIKKGAAAIFTDQEIKNKEKFSKKVPIIEVDNARAYLGELASDFYNNPSEKLQLIGITGTNGKTTTTHLIYQLINYCSNYNNSNNSNNYKKAGLIGTVHVDNGKSIIPGDLTTPDAVQLQKYLKDMLDSKLKYSCMEVSSHGIKLERIAGSKFAIKVGTNISADHFDLHPSFEDYVNVKKSFLKADDGALVLLNNDDKYINSFGKIAENQITFGINSKADVTCTNIKNSGKGHDFIYSLNSKMLNENNDEINPYQIPIEINLPGYHNIYNALIAITIARYYNIPSLIIQEFFKKFRGIWRRLQFVYDKEFTIIDDCAHNPGSYQAVFNAISKMNYNKLIIVNSLRGNRGVRINQENAETLSQSLMSSNDFQLLTSNCNDVVKKIDKVYENEEEIFIRTLRKNELCFEHFQDLRPALERALDLVDRNDIILLLGPHAMDDAAESILNLISEKEDKELKI